MYEKITYYSRMSQTLHVPVPASVGGWTPASLGSALVAWYKADTDVTVLGGFVTAVKDQSTNGYDLVNNNQVPFNATSAYNSQPAFDFAAANAAILYTGIGNDVTLPVANNLSVFFVGRMTGGASGGGAVTLAVQGATDWDNTNGIAALTRQGTNDGIETYYNSGVTIVDDAISLNVNYRLGVVIDNSNATHYINNIAGTPQAITLNLATANNIYIGNRKAGNDTLNVAAWDGPILEVVIIGDAISSTNRDNLDTYFVAKWGS